MTTITMADSYYQTLLIEGKTRKLQALVDLASRDRSPGEAKKYAAEAQTILRDLAELDERILASEEAPTGLDYRDDTQVYIAIVRYLTHLGHPASEAEITKELIRGKYPGYRNSRVIAIRVGRCVRSYDTGRGKDNPKLKYKRGLVGLPEWPDKTFS
jgi:hypothetical protein